jgi:hypothetical protein
LLGGLLDLRDQCARVDNGDSHQRAPPLPFCIISVFALIEDLKSREALKRKGATK